MYCKNCGSEIPAGADHCPNCGEAAPNEEIKGFTPAQETYGGNDAGQASGFNAQQGSYNAGQTGGYDAQQGSYSAGQTGGYDAQQSADGTYNQQMYTNNTWDGNYQYGSAYQNPFNPPTPLKTDRSFWMYLLLGVITCGIYDLVFMHYLVKDVNTACDGDGKHTTGFLLMVLLSIITCGIYGFVWYYQLGNRLAENGRRYGYNVVETGTSVLLWMLLGSFLCGIGTFIAINIVITNTNVVCTGYNRTYGLG